MCIRDSIQLMQQNFKHLYPDNANLESARFLNGKITEIERDVFNIRDFLKIDLSGKDLSMVKNFNEKLLAIQRQADANIDLICKLRPELCSRQQAATQNMKNTELSNLFTRSDSVARQTEVFYSLFQFQLNRLARVPETSKNAELRFETARMAHKLAELTVAISLLEGKNIHPATYSHLTTQ